MIVRTIFTVLFPVVNLFQTIYCTKINVVKSHGDIQFGNIAKTSDGDVLQKSESLLSRTTVSSEEECWFKCVEESSCLSLNVMVLNDGKYMCETFNWTGTNMSGMLAPKLKSYHATIQVSKQIFIDSDKI